MTTNDNSCKSPKLEDSRIWNSIGYSIAFGNNWDFGEVGLKGDVYVCAHCLDRFESEKELSKHSRHCSTAFRQIIFSGLGMQIAKVTLNSPQIEKQICERMSKLSMIERTPQLPAVHQENWCTKTWQSKVFLLMRDTVVVGYLAIGKLSLKIGEYGRSQSYIVTDMFIGHYWRKRGYMRLLLEKSLDSMHNRFDSVLFQEPISESGEEFLNRIAQETGYQYRTKPTVPLF